MAYKYARIGGTKVELAKLKDGIANDFNLSQRDFADIADLHQGHISKILCGKRPVNGKFAKAVIKVAARNAKALSDYSPPAAAQGPQTFEDVIDSLTSDEAVEESLPNKSTDFPLDKAQQVAGMARTAAREGLDYSGTFSLRKLIKWGRAFHILLKAGLDWEQAVGGAYWLAAVYAADDEGRRFLLESFQRVFAFDAERPVDVIDHDPSQHPAEPLMELFARAGEPVWAFGPTGCGKTHAAKAVAKRLSSTGHFFRFQGDENKNVDDFVGSYGAKDGSTFVYKGVLPKGMEAGEPVIIDEPAACEPGVLMALQAVLEGDDLSITKAEGDVIRRKSGFVIIACDNTRGLGEAHEYVSTKPINEAMRDRFVFIEFDYMPEDQERDIAKSEISNWLGNKSNDDSEPTVNNGDDSDSDQPEWYDRLAS